MSINDAQAIGGHFVKLSDKWSLQKEAIALSILRVGDNVIRFSLPAEATYHYQVKAISIVIEKRITHEATIILNQSNGNYYNNQAYLKGILQFPAQEYIQDSS